MQLVKTQRDALLRPLQIVSGIVERRHTLPILANILIRKDRQAVSFLSTDIEVQITTQADIGPGDDAGATTVSARKLLDILRALPESGEVTLSVANKKMTVQSGKSRFNLQTLAPEEFPTVAQPERYNASLKMAQKTLKHLFSMVHFAMAQQDIRYYLNGLLLVVDGAKVIAVATDGHRLAYCSVALDAPAERAGASTTARHDVIIPRKTVVELQRLLDDSDEPVEIDIAGNQARFRFGGIELISKLVEGKFPDYQRVIPSGYSRTFTVPREAWLRALTRVAILTSDKFKGVRFILSDDTVKISSTNADQEDAQDEIDIDYRHGPLDIGFNVSYLLDVLNNLKAESVQVAMGDSNSSALITVPDDDDFKYVVMPMRI